MSQPRFLTVDTATLSDGQRLYFDAASHSIKGLEPSSSPDPTSEPGSSGASSEAAPNPIAPFLVTQAGHGFVEGLPARAIDNDTYGLPNIDNPTLADVVGWVVGVPDADHFLLQPVGPVVEVPYAAFVAGNRYYLSGDGGLETVPPDYFGGVVQPLLIAINATHGVVLPGGQHPQQFAELYQVIAYNKALNFPSRGRNYRVTCNFAAAGQFEDGFYRVLVNSNVTLYITEELTSKTLGRVALMVFVPLAGGSYSDPQAATLTLYMLGAWQNDSSTPPTWNIEGPL